MLTPEAPPTLIAGGALLAATFIAAGLAQGDAAVLKRLLALLTAPLSLSEDKSAVGGLHI